jgi:glycerol kinase
MCYSTKDVLEAMKKDSGLKIRELKVDGGAVANDLLCRFQADILRMNVIRPKVIESTSLGAAYLAGLAVGYFKGPAEIKRFWVKDKVFGPVLSRTSSEKFYGGWLKAVRKTVSK